MGRFDGVLFFFGVYVYVGFGVYVIVVVDVYYCFVVFYFGEVFV